jgi:hypothetical protein
MIFCEGKMKAFTGALLCWLCFLLLPRPSFADGGMFSPLVAAVDIPEQSAIVSYDGSSERLIVSTSFTGPQGEYAWVMPLPATPNVQGVSNGILPTLHTMCRPRLEVVPRSYLFIIAFAATLWLAVFVRRNRALVVALLVLIIAVPWIYGYFLAALEKRPSKTAAEAPAEAGVSVQQRLRVGEYDVATVTARSSRALLDWLKENGFKVGPGIAPALDNYIRDGWCFTVYRFSPLAGSARSHPLSFTFPARKAVYPMRLTGVESKRLKLELFVLGDEEAAVPGMELRRCGYPRLDTRDFYFYSENEDDREIPVFHPGVAAVVKPYKVLTALFGNFSAQQMTRDYEIVWKPPSPYRILLYTSEAAGALTRWYGAVAFCALTVLAVAWVAWRTRARETIAAVPARWLIWAAGILLVIAALLMLHDILLSSISTAAIAGAILIFLLVMWLACFAPWRPKLTSHTVLYFLFIPLLSLWFHVPSLRHLNLEIGTLQVARNSAFAVLAYFGSLGWKGRPSERDRKTARWAFYLVLCSILVGVTTWSVADAALRPRIVEKTVEGGSMPAYWNLWRDVSFPNEAAAHEFAARRIADWNSKGTRNPYTGEPLREEDSPGNYQILRQGDDLALYTFDADGGLVWEAQTSIPH